MRRIWAWLGGVLLLCGWTGMALANDPESPLPYSADNHFVIESGLYGFHPRFNNNPAFFLTRNSVSPFGLVPQDTQATHFSNGFDVLPQVHLGYVDLSGLGVHSRFWMLDQDADATLVTTVGADPTIIHSATTAAPLGLSFTSIAVPVLPDTWTLNSNLRMYVVDAEAAQEIEFGPWLLTVGGGIRYVHLAQGYNASRSRSGNFIDPTSGDFVQLFTDSNGLTSRTDFDGIGPLVGVESRRRLGDSPLSLFGLARGTVLFGNTNQTVTLNTIRNTRRELAIGGVVVEDTNTTQTASNSTNDLLPTVEMEVGVEFDHIIGGIRFFCQTSFVGQAWLGGGNASGTNAPTAGSGALTQSNFGFLGLSFRGGLMF